MQCMTRLINSPPPPGVYDVVNQISGISTLMDLAKTVGRIGKKEFGLNTRIQRLENPRVEADEHPFEVLYSNLPDKFGFEPLSSLDEEVYRMFELLTRKEIKARLEEKEHVILPRTRWSGKKQDSKVIEVIEF